MENCKILEKSQIPDTPLRKAVYTSEEIERLSKRVSHSSVDISARCSNVIEKSRSRDRQRDLIVDYGQTKQAGMAQAKQKHASRQGKAGMHPKTWCASRQGNLGK
jgi:hypothetical protein